MERHAGDSIPKTTWNSHKHYSKVIEEDKHKLESTLEEIKQVTNTTKKMKTCPIEGQELLQNKGKGPAKGRGYVKKTGLWPPQRQQRKVEH